jgi:hypothetical protein
VAPLRGAVHRLGARNNGNTTGTYIFNDGARSHSCVASRDTCALTVLTNGGKHSRTRPRRGDAGSKTLTP